MKNPDTIKVESNGNSKTIQIKTYDQMLLIFQFGLILFPFLTIEVFIFYPWSPMSFLIFIIGLVSITLWIIANIKSGYRVFVDPKKIVFSSGFLSQKTISTNFKDIKSIKVNHRKGKVMSGGRAGVTTVGPDVSDYYIVTDKEEYLMIPKATRREKEYIRKLITSYLA